MPARSKRQGISTLPQAMLKDLLKAGKGFCHPELTKTLVGNGVEAFDFIVNTARNSSRDVPGGMTAKRLLQPDYNGATGLLALRESYLKMGGQPSCAARSTGCCSIVTDGSRRRCGAYGLPFQYASNRTIREQGRTPVRYRAKRA